MSPRCAPHRVLSICALHQLPQIKVTPNWLSNSWSELTAGLRSRQVLSEEDQSDWELDPSSVGAFVATVFRTSSSAEALEAVNKCQPAEFARDVLRSALDALSNSVPIEDLVAWLDGFDVPAEFVARFAAEQLGRGNSPPDKVVRRIFLRLIDEPAPAAEMLDDEWPSDFLEMTVPVLTRSEARSWQRGCAPRRRPAVGN